MRLIVVSGQSGAGKSVALRVLEDLGYYCVDNLPVNLLDNFVKSVKSSKQNVAVSIDIRNLPTEPNLVTDVLTRLKKSSDVSVLFLDAQKTRCSNATVKRGVYTLFHSVSKIPHLNKPLKKNVVFFPHWKSMPIWSSIAATDHYMT